jgi:hypothetical protein
MFIDYKYDKQRWCIYIYIYNFDRHW